MANTRELSQLASVISVADETKNVGIGTTNPTSTLTVSGNTLVSGMVTGNTFRARGGGPGNLGVNNNGYGFFGSGDNDSGMYSSTDGQIEFYSNNGEAARITSNRNLLIGAITETGTASQPLQVTGGAYVSGNLGIGTTTPTSKLHVVGNVRVSGVVTATDFNSTSDINLKENIKIIEDPLDKIIKLNGVTFNWKENQKPSIGVIAQELEKVLPELVTQGDIKTVNYNGIIGVLIEAVKEQQKQIEELKNLIV